MVRAKGDAGIHSGKDNNATVEGTKDAVATSPSDEVTVPQSGGKSSNNNNSNNVSSSKGAAVNKKKKKRISQDLSSMSVEEQLSIVKEQVQQEKAGKRKLFLSLVKLANELRRVRDESVPLLEQREYAERNWYDGGIWRAPAVLPGVYAQTFRASRLRQAISLADLFFGLTIVTAFTRVGVAISTEGFVDINSLLYFAVFWTVSGKEARYSTRFDTTDLSAQAVTLVTCFAVLFASLSVQQPINSVDGTRVMVMAAFVSGLHILLYVRVLVTERWREGDNEGDTSTDGKNINTDKDQGQLENDSENKETGDENMTVQPTLRDNVRSYAILNIFMGVCELLVWVVGVVVFPEEWPDRWLLFLGGIVFAFRIPMVFLPSDFYASCSKRGVLFTLLLGFMLQSIIVVASEFFSYQTPNFENYSFIGACCLMLFCMKLLYVDDADVPAEDHASKINRTAAFFFNVGQFALMLSTTVLGSGLNLLTHDYLSATQALSGPSKSLVCGGFSAALFSTFFIKSMHLKRVPANGLGQCLFISAYFIQASVLLAVMGVAAAMAYGNVTGLLAILLQSDILLLISLSGAALVVVLMHWLDEGVELALYGTAETGRSYRVHPFGFWWCIKPSDGSSHGSPSASPATSGVEDFRLSGLDFYGSGRLGESALFLSPSTLSLHQEESSTSIMSPLLGGTAPRDYKSTSSPIAASGEFV
ncbi:hypothetical protein ACA910_022081 [Epithemia clementina (nom. ined.)]